MVDVWGDIPFSEFNKFKEGVVQPAFDDDKDIYPQLFTMIDAGIADINNPAANPSVPGTDDVIYSGNTGRWIKAANTLKLKLYTQIRKVQDVSTQVNALLATPANLINAKEESFVIQSFSVVNSMNVWLWTSLPVQEWRLGRPLWLNRNCPITHSYRRRGAATRPPSRR